MTVSFSNPAWAIPLLTFVIVLALMPRGIAWLKRLNFGQSIREDGPQSHLSKAGTPTMGGILFIPIAVVLAVLFAFQVDEQTGFLVLLVGAFTNAGLLIGWIDDYRSVKRGKSLGLKAREKLLLQFIICGLFLGALRFLVPEFIGYPSQGSLGIWQSSPVYFFVILVAMVWLINAANIADGLDGLASGQTVVSLSAIILFAPFFHPFLPGIAESSMVMIAALLAFLCYNAPPARVFMGDTGSIALGCWVAGTAVLVLPFWMLLLITAVWSLEALSVVIQVIYFKRTGGKRIFRMAPIHHHFELAGWPETQVTMRFIVASIVLGILLPAALLPLVLR